MTHIPSAGELFGWGVIYLDHHGNPASSVHLDRAQAELSARDRHGVMLDLLVGAMHAGGGRPPVTPPAAGSAVGSSGPH